MQKRTLFPFYFFLALLFSISINGCITYKPVSIKEIKSVELLNNDISSGKLSLSLRVANPNNYPIKIKKYDLHGYLNNQDLGPVLVDEKTVLKRNSEEDYRLTLSPDVEKILEVLPSLVFKGSGEIALKGSVKVKALFLSRKFNINLKKRVSARDFR